MLFFPVEDIEDIIGADEAPTSCATCEGIFPAAALYPKGNCATCDADIAYFEEHKAEIGFRDEADDALMFGCGHCGHECHVNELKSGACPRCGTLKEGVLVVAKVEKWAERHDATLIRPQGHCVVVDGWRV